MGTMWRPRVTEARTEGEKQSPLKTISGFPSAPILFMKVAKRAAPPTGSLERDSTSYTSLKCTILKTFSESDILCLAVASSRTESDFCLQHSDLRDEEKERSRDEEMKRWRDEEMKR